MIRQSDIEDISGSMERALGIKGDWVNVFDGKVFWRVLTYMVDGETQYAIYDENDTKTNDEEVAAYILPAVKEYNNNKEGK